MVALAIDTETTGIDLHHGCHPFYVTICYGADVIHWEWEVDPLTRLPIIPPGDLDDIRDRLSEADLIVGQNLKFDISALASIGIEWLIEWFAKSQDTILSGHLLASAERHDLTSMALRYLNINIQPYEDVLEVACKEARRLCARELSTWKIIKEGMYPSAKTTKAKKSSEKDKLWKWDMWLPKAVAEFKKYPADHPWRTHLINYSDTDSAVTLPLYEEHQRLMGQRGLTGLYEIRRGLIKEICRMEARGITYSERRLAERCNQFNDELTQARSTCLKLSNGKLTELPEGGSTSKALSSFVFDDLKLPVIERSEKTKTPSINKVALQAWIDTQPATSRGHIFAHSLRTYRTRKTALSYSEGYRRYGKPPERSSNSDYRVLHSAYNPTGSDTLRFSCNNPNTENISKQEETDLRYAFGPLPGREWWSLDYENIELRIPAYTAGEDAMIRLFEHPEEAPYYGSQHLLVAHILWPKEFDACLAANTEFKKIYKATLYQWTKNGNFAVTYGALEEFGTADRAYHQPGAHKKVMQRFQKIEALNQEKIAYAKRYGFVYTLPDVDTGIGYPIQCTRNKWGSIRPTVPLNYFSQGTAMWCTSKAMVRCGAYLDTLPDHYMTAQVHDELLFDFPKSKKPFGNLPKALELKRLMEQSGKDVGIPTPVNYTYHPANWKDETEVPETTTL